MRGSATAAALMLVAALSPAAARAEDARVAYLRAHEARVRSITPRDRDFSDLEPLRAAIGTRRLVMLGEETHGDGPTFLAKTRLIEFLHERMGFNVLAFESGFYDVHRAWADVASGSDPMQAIRSSIFHLWTDVEQTQDLWQYVVANARTNRPLILAGIDSQFTGAMSQEHLVADLNAVVSGLPPDARLEASRRRVVDVLAAYFAARREGGGALAAFQKQTTLADQARFYIALFEIRRRLAAQEHADPAKAVLRDYWVQLLDSTSTQLQHFWHVDLASPAQPGPKFDWADFNLRDRQMAENLAWLAQREYPNEKIIVWAATSHEMRHREFLTDEYAPYVPMGDWLDRIAKAQVYTIGFTAFEGKAGIGSDWDIGVAAPGSLEALIHATGEEYAFVDFRHLGVSGAWLTDLLSCRPLGYQPNVTSWPATMDGLFYIERMTPSTLVPGRSL